MFSNNGSNPEIKASILTINDILHGDIYYEDLDSLANRIDFAWSAYKDTMQPEALRIKALNFLTDVFSISSEYKNKDRLFEYLIKKREKYKQINPEYIPALSPFYPMPFHTSRFVPEKIEANSETRVAEIKQAIQSGKLLDVNDDNKIEDPYFHTPLLEREERWRFRVQIIRGKFNRDGQLFDTSYKESHHKLGYASFTLNTNGELSLFTHTGKAGNLTHSSMNAGAPVLCAGELKIRDGVLEAITTYSGHYEPSIFNIYELLKYFSKNGIEITNQIKIFSQNDISLVLNGITSQETHFSGDPNPWYETPANQIYTVAGKGMQNDLDNIITSIRTNLKLWTSDQDASPLTNERIKLINEFADALLQFIASIDTPDVLTPCVFKYSIHELKNLISAYEKQNTAISEKYHNNSSNLANCFSFFKIKIKETKHIDHNILKDPDRFSKMKLTF